MHQSAAHFILRARASLLLLPYNPNPNPNPNTNRGRAPLSSSFSLSLFGARAQVNLVNEAVGLCFVALVMWPPNGVTDLTGDVIAAVQAVAEAWLFEAGNTASDASAAFAAAKAAAVGLGGNATGAAAGVGGNATGSATVEEVAALASTLVPFAAYFWSAFGIALIYPVYALDGIKLAQKHRLGYDERTGRKAALCTGPWLYVFGLSLLGNTLYMQVLKTLIAVLVCDYDTGTLARDPSMECWSWSHCGYIIAAAVAALCYYPVSTFLYPNFQFADKTLDLKFEPSFLVVVGQAKLLLSGVSAFSESEVIALPLLCAICSLLSFLSWRMAPCLIHKVNPWRTVGYGCAA